MFRVLRERPRLHAAAGPFSYPPMTERLRIAIAIAASAIGIVVFAVVLVHAVWYAPDVVALDPQATAAEAQSTPPPEEPQRLIIPAINVDANVQQVGVNAKGAMGVPNNFTDVAWFKQGPLPGQQGSAVIDGHVDNGLGLAGVFKNLSEVVPGDEVEVRTKQGELLHFTVEDVETYPYTAVPTDLIFNPAGPPRLALITCDGAWVAGEKTYDHRLVVYARFTGAS